MIGSAKLGAALLALIGVVGVASPALAHQLGRSYCTVTTVPGGLDVVVETSFEHLAPILAPDPVLIDADIVHATPGLHSALAKAVTAQSAGAPCSSEAGSPEFVTAEGQRAARVLLRFSCPPGPITLKNVWRFDVDPKSEVVCAIDGSAWVFRVGAEAREVGTPPTLGQVLVSFVKLGVHHVLSGIDHLLFVVALLLAAARASRGQTLLRGLREVALVVTENVLRREIRWRTLTAGAFGLIHGFGFASVLAETELPRRGAVWALLTFNLGIELGQLAVVALLFVPLALSARRGWYERRLLWPASIVIGLLAAVWLVKRAFGLQFAGWLGA